MLALKVNDLFHARFFGFLYIHGYLWMDVGQDQFFSLPVRVANHCAGFSSSCPLAEVAMHIIKNEVAEGNTNMVRLTETIM